MGLLDAVGYGLAQGTAGMAEDITAQIKSDIEMMRAETLMQSKQAREDQERIRRTGEIESRAGLINARKNEPIQKEGDTASAAYQKALDAGAIDEAGAESGKTAASEYVSKNTRPVDYVDRLEAASQLGYVDPEKMAGVQLNERRADRAEKAATAKAILDERKIENQERRTDLMDKRLLAAISGKGAKEGELPSDAKMSEWLVKQGVYPDVKTAFEHVKQGKAKDDVAIQASVFAKLIEDNSSVDKKAAWKEAGALVSGSRSGDNDNGKSGAKTDEKFNPGLGWSIKRK